MHRPCLIRSCPNPAAPGSGYCHHHQHHHVPIDNRPSFRERGYLHVWTRLSETYRRSHPCCEDCLERGIYRPAEMVHHLTPIQDGGDLLDMSNLRALCRPCHARHHHQHGATRHARP